MRFYENMTTVVVCGLILAFPAHGDIIGGTEVGPKDPIRESTVGIYDPSEGALCTASLIGKHTAVTAAHCMNSSGRKPVVLFGRDFRALETVRRQATAVAVNPRWESSRGQGMDQGDIAVVRFPGDLPVGYRPVEMAEGEEPLKKGRKAVLAGYGISNARTRSGAGVLRKTSVKIENPRRGKTEMILDQTHGKGACHGDSGGPAFVRQGGKVVLAGVTNRGYPPRSPDDCAHKVVYTKVDSYRKWIDQKKRDLEKPEFRQGLRKKVHRRGGVRKAGHGKTGKAQAHRKVGFGRRHQPRRAVRS